MSAQVLSLSATAVLPYPRTRPNKHVQTMQTALGLCACSLGLLLRAKLLHYCCEEVVAWALMLRCA
jgi:hypothetical protein